MRIIPKKIKVKNTIWKCYSLADILVALFLFIILFILLTKGQFILSILILLFSICILMPTQNGIFYTCIFDNLKFIGSKKHYQQNAKNKKEKIDKIIGIQELKENGTIEYQNHYFSKVIKIGQKNFGMEDVQQQNVDIHYLANALKQLEEGQMIDIVKIDRPMNLDSFAKDLFLKIKTVENSLEDEKTKEIKINLLKERIDKIDKLNNIKKQYLSDFYMVIYTNKEKDLEQLVINVSSEIHKSGLTTKILDVKETAIFLKYNFSKNFDEREVKSIENNQLLKWILPQKIDFKSNKYYIDELETATFAIVDYPLKVKNAWGSELFHIPNTKAVMRIKPVEKYKAIRRIDKCISEMETKQIIAEKASETNYAQIHQETMYSLLDSLLSENESLYDVSIFVTAYNYLNDSNYKRKVRREILLNNFKVSNLYGLQIQSFKKMNLPIQTLSLYERSINSSSLCAVYPFVRTFSMDEGGILLGRNKNNFYPFILNLWKRNHSYQNSNAMVIGKSGSGKSYFLKNLIINEWANGTRIILLDPEAEYVQLTKKINGNLIDVGNAKDGKINPFHIYNILTENGETADSIITFNTHLKTLESFFNVVLVGASNDVKELINHIVVETYEKKGINEMTDCSMLSATDFPTFSDVLTTLEQKTKTKTTLKDYQMAELYLKKFVNGRYSDIWNSPSDLNAQKDFINFNFQSLFATKNKIVANAQMLLIFKFIEQEIINAREINKNGQNLKTLIVCDEAHLFIDEKYPIALDFFYSMSKRIRKYNGSFIPATQNIADWNANEELKNKTSTIVKNSQYTFIFKLSAPDMLDVLDIYKVGDSFNKEEQKQIISATTGQVFFVGSTESRACIKIEAGEYAQSLFLEDEWKEERD